MKQTKILFVCMGNICRSPTAHGIFQNLVDEQSLSDQFIIESAGTTGYHAGEPPDNRACLTAINRGVDLSNLSARQITKDDYLNQDYIIAMDYANLANMERECPEQFIPKLKLLLEFHANPDLEQVPDPYYGGDSGFEDVFDMVEIACKNLFEQIKH